MQKYLLVLLLLFPVTAIAQNPSEKKVAFVIGNQKYLEKDDVLENATNDADSMAQVLRGLKCSSEKPK